MKRLSFLVVTLVALATLAACGGPQEEAIKPGDIATVPNPQVTRKVTSGDVAFELPPVEIKGVVYEPTALGRPGMPLVEAKKKTTLEKQRAAVQGTKDPVQKQAQAAVLATMLYLDSKNNKANEKQLLGDARQVLRDVAQQAGEKNVDEITLRLLGSYELLLEDYPAAEKAWQTVIDKDPKSKDNPYNRAWLGFALLKQFKNAEALAAVGSEKLDDKQPELAYVIAWAKWRNGDPAGAWQSISVAAKGWGSNPKRDELEQEVMQFAARANITLDQAVAMANALAKARVEQYEQSAKVKLSNDERTTRTKPLQYELIAKLALAGYGAVGRWSDGVNALTKAVEVAGDAVPPNDRPVIRYEQADFTVPLDTPDVAAGYAKQAVESLQACGAKCADKDKLDTINRVYLMGRLFHILYATANDKRYYEPARDLYALTIPLLGDAATKTQAQKDAKVLETTFKNIKVGTGTHDKGALDALFHRHNPEVDGCYEAVLGANPKLGGTITMMLESDATGAIKGASTEPKAGAAGLSAVAGCIAEHAKQWKLPRRGMPGNTRIKMSYTLAVKK
jgi:tetratricopeptide (TPR) repeat protein